MDARVWSGGRVIATVVMSLVASQVLAPAASKAEEVQFAGKTVRMLVSSNAGGVTDVGARVVARFMGKYLPDSPSIVIQNMPGANGIAAANLFYLRSPPDGLLSFAGSSSQVTPDVVRANPSVQYDLKKFKWIGGVHNAGSVAVTTRDGAKRLIAGEGAPLTIGQVGGARTEAMIFVWAAEYLGWKVRFITGYQGNQEIAMAMRKGELDMLNTSSYAGLHDLLKSGDQFVAVMQGGVRKNGVLKRREGFEQVPILSEVIAGKLTGKAKSAYDSWMDSIEIGKYFSMPPNAPDNYVEAYRAAYVKMNDDPEFRSQAAIAFEPDYVMMSPAELAAVVDRMAAAEEEDYRYVDKLREKYGLSAGESAKN